MPATDPNEMSADKTVQPRPGETGAGASYDVPEELMGSLQMPLDLVDETSMASFPCSDPPAYPGFRV